MPESDCRPDRSLGSLRSIYHPCPQQPCRRMENRNQKKERVSITNDSLPSMPRNYVSTRPCCHDQGAEGRRTSYQPPPPVEAPPVSQPPEAAAEVSPAPPQAFPPSPLGAEVSPPPPPQASPASPPPLPSPQAPASTPPTSSSCSDGNWRFSSSSPSGMYCCRNSGTVCLVSSRVRTRTGAIGSSRSV